MHWAQNTAKHHRINSQRNIYLKKHPEDNNLTEEALKIILNKGNEEFTKLLSRMQKFNANIVGSNAYFYKKKYKS